jgi:hypothetical protein
MYPKTQKIREERRAIAEARQAAYAALPLEEKIRRQEPFKGKQYQKLLAAQVAEKAPETKSKRRKDATDKNAQ